MKFLKLHNNGRKVLVNMSTVAEIYDMPDQKKSVLYLNFELKGIELREQARIKVDESVDEIYEKLNRVREVI